MQNCAFSWQQIKICTGSLFHSFQETEAPSTFHCFKFTCGSVYFSRKKCVKMLIVPLLKFELICGDVRKASSLIVQL